MEQLTESQADSCMPQQAIWRGLVEEFLHLVSIFIESSQKFIFYFLHDKAANRKYRFDF